MIRFFLLAPLLVSILAVGVARAEITIAMVGPLTGPSSAIGEQMQKGAEMAVRHINASGGVLGQPLALEVGDDTCDPDDAVAVAEQLRDSRAVFVAGHYCSGASIPASKVYAEAGILQISPGSTNPTLTDQGLDNVFRVCGRDDLQGPTAANYVLDNQLASRIAVVHDKSAYGKGLADEFRRQLVARGTEEVLYTGIDAGVRDFSGLIDEMKAADVELIYFGGYHLEAGLIVRQARDLGLGATLMSGDTLLTREFWDITAEAGEGTLFTFEADPRSFDFAEETVLQFRESGYEPEGYTLFTYAAIEVFAQAAEIAGTTELAAVVEALKNNQFDTKLGQVAFDAKGRRHRDGLSCLSVFRRSLRDDQRLIKQTKTSDAPMARRLKSYRGHVMNNHRRHWFLVLSAALLMALGAGQAHARWAFVSPDMLANTTRSLIETLSTKTIEPHQCPYHLLLEDLTILDKETSRQFHDALTASIRDAHPEGEACMVVRHKLGGPDGSAKTREELLLLLTATGPGTIIEMSYLNMSKELVVMARATSTDGGYRGFTRQVHLPARACGRRSNDCHRREDTGADGETRARGSSRRNSWKSAERSRITSPDGKIDAQSGTGFPGVAGKR